MKQNKNLGKFFGKCALILLPFALFFSLVIYTDIFNVFHPNSIRITRGMPNERFLKMRYLLENPESKNALVFGSSRIGYIPTFYLNNNSDLTWYNMTYSAGVLEEHLKDIEILIENNVPIQKIMIVFDDVPFNITAEEHYSDLMRVPYCEYLRLGYKFYIPYLYQFNFSILKDVLAHKLRTEQFYSDGSRVYGEEKLIQSGEDIDHPSNQTHPFIVSADTVLNQIRTIKALCDDNGIETIFVTNPIWKRTYLDACDNGYLDFLRQVTEITPFMNFSCLNEVTCDGRNYREGSHYKPNVGLLMLRVFLDENFEERESLASSQFGVWVTSDNVDSVISSLQAQLDSTLDTDIGN